METYTLNLAIVKEDAQLLDTNEEVSNDDRDDNVITNSVELVKKMLQWLDSFEPT